MPLLLLLLLFLPIQGFSSGHSGQVTAWANSPDGHLLAVNYLRPQPSPHAGGQAQLHNVLRVYNPALGLQLQEIALTDREPVSQVGFGLSGDWLFAQGKRRISVCHAQTGKILHEISLPADIIAIEPAAEGLAVLLAGEMRLYQFFPRKRLLTYKHLPADPVGLLVLGHYLAVQTAEGRWYFWQVGDNRPLGSLEANQLRYLAPSNQLVALRQSEQGAVVARYLLPDLSAPREMALDKLLPPGAELTLSPNAAFLAMTTSQPKQVKVLHLGQRRWVFGYQNDQLPGRPSVWQWQQDSLLVAKFGQRFAAVDLADGSFVQFVQFPALATPGGEPRQQLAPALDWSASTVPGQEVALCSGLSGHTYRYPRTTLLALLADRAILADDQGQTGSVQFADLLAEGADQAPPALRLFLPQLPAPTAAALISRRTELLSPAEGAMARNQFIRARLPIADHVASLTLKKLHLRNFIVKNRQFHVNLHLTDAQGNYFGGAADPDWQHVWNKLVVVPVSSDQALPIADYQLREFTEADSVPCAFALLADHTAGQGPIRPAAMVRAFAQFVAQKQPQDAVALLKYVRDAQVFAPLNRDSRTLLLQLQQLDSLGSEPGAALNDAISAAVSQLDKMPHLMQRAIVIVSDGRNEKSFLSETTILTKVLRKGIRIYTVGFGDQIDDEYLRKLAHVTDGEYYYALTEKDFSRIFADIQQRMHQFYQLSFSPVAHGLTREVAEGGLMALVETFGDGQGEELFQVRPSEARQALAKPIRPPRLGDTRLVDIYFAPGKTDIVQQNEDEMERIAQLLADYPFAEIEIRGHTDNTGNAKQNEALSQARAEAVRRLLLAWGVEPHRVRALGFGASQPVADNQTETGRAKNRRTELVVVAN
jgi:outer membrane protein OmpA-like peptidoglycan-associated protein